jgi:hypothetical protein
MTAINALRIEWMQASDQFHHRIIAMQKSLGNGVRSPDETEPMQAWMETLEVFESEVDVLLETYPEVPI